ncbi:MAG: HDOD domain-containing protein [Verrucomicrobia bacterium]|nr:HDOD domain-containing protein [Verrucomicrobiota bacterium]
MRILIVDGDAEALRGMRKMLKFTRDVWLADFTGDHEEALSLISREQYDVIMVDLRMPAIGDAGLLEVAVRDMPEALRVILCGEEDRDEAIKLIGIAHQYILKPFDVEGVSDTIKRALIFREILQSGALKKAVSQMKSLPSIPSLYTDLLKELRRDDPSVIEIGSIISRDMGMCSKMLQLVNSAFFGLSREVANPMEAVVLLGVDTVKALVLSLQIFAVFDKMNTPRFSLDRLWSHCWRTGVMARRVAEFEELSRGEADLAFLSGLLHDVGKLVLFTGLPEQYGEAIALMASRDITIKEAEFEVFGVTHSEAGAYLLGLWGLPNQVLDAVAYHHRPSEGVTEGLGLPVIIHASNFLQHESASDDAHGGAGQRDIDMEYFEELGLQDNIEKWRELV